MPTPLTLDLSDKERRRLEKARDYHDKPYVRESAGIEVTLYVSLLT